LDLCQVLGNQRRWFVQPTSAMCGEGVHEAMDWILANMGIGGGGEGGTGRKGAGVLVDKTRHYPERHLKVADKWRARQHAEEKEQREKEQRQAREDTAVPPPAAAAAAEAASPDSVSSRRPLPPHDSAAMAPQDVALAASDVHVHLIPHAASERERERERARASEQARERAAQTSGSEGRGGLSRSEGGVFANGGGAASAERAHLAPSNAGHAVKVKHGMQVKQAMQ